MAVAASACGGGSGFAGGPVSFEEYVELCGTASAVSSDDASVAEFSELLDEQIRRMESVTPPGEVADLHNVILEYQRALKEVLDDIPDSDSDNPLEAVIFSGALVLLFEFGPAISDAAAAVPAEFQQQLVEAGCIEDEGFTLDSDDDFLDELPGEDADESPPEAVPIEPVPSATSDDPEPARASATTTATRISRADFEASAPEGYARVTVNESGVVWGTPARYTSDSRAGTVAYMLLGEAGGCGLADTQAARGATAYIRVAPLGFLSSFESATACNSTSNTWESGWDGLRITHLRVFDEVSPTNVTEYVYDGESGLYADTSPAPAARRTAE